MTLRCPPVFLALGAVLFLAPGAHAQAPAGEPAAPPAAAPPASPAGESAPAAAPPPEAAPVPPPPPAATPAAAAPPPPAPLPEAPPPADAVPMGAGAETHDGFYMRISLGGGGLSMQRDTEGQLQSGLLYGGESSISGGASHFELSIGGTPGGGVAIAGTILTYSMPDATLENDSGGEVEMGGPLNFAVLGASVDWFPNKQGGFHFGGTLGFAAASAETPDGSPVDFIGGVGGALSLAVGYDWWIGDEWSLGVQGRLTGAGVEGEATANVAGIGEVTGEETSSLSAFTIAITVLHH